MTEPDEDFAWYRQAFQDHVDLIDRQQDDIRRLVRWQAEAVEVLKRWDQVADLVPGSFLVPGANRSACVHAYIDHLQTWNRALHRGEVPG